MNNEDTQSKTENSVNGFEKLIQAIPKGSMVLDVGAGGLEGFNTTDFLIARFGVKNVKGICIRPEKVTAYLIAAVVGAAIFSAVHYIGPLGDVFELPSFIFRFLFGLALNALFLVRGFGVAAWTHALYDILVVSKILG